MSPTLKTYARSVSRRAQLVASWCLLFVLAGVPTGIAQESSVSQFERDCKRANEQIDALLAAEFAGATAAMEELRKPLAVGDAVEFELRRGGSRETMKGRFNGVMGQYVRISSSSVLLADVPADTKARFMAAQYPERRDQIIADRQEELTSSMERRRRQLQPDVMREMGYGPQYFDANVQFGDTIYPLAKLGHGEMFAVFSIVDGDSLIACRLVNRAKLPVSVVAVLDGRGVGTSVEQTQPTGVGTWDRDLDFYIPRSRFNSLDALISSLRLVCRKGSSWELRPLPDVKRKTGTTNRNDGVYTLNQILITFALVPEKADPMTTDLAKLPEIPVTSFQRWVAEAQVVKEEVKLIRSQEEAKAAADAAARQAQNEVAAAAVSAAVDEAQAIAKEAETPRVIEVSSLDGPLPEGATPVQLPATVTVNIAALKPAVTELKAAGVAIGPLPDDGLSQPGDLSNVPNITNHILPEAVGDVAIAGGTPFARFKIADPDLAKSLQFPDARFLLGSRKDSAVYFLQISVQTSSGSVIAADLLASVSFDEGGKRGTRSAKLLAPPQWIGKIFLYFEIPVTVVKSGTGDIDLSVRRVEQ